VETSILRFDAELEVHLNNPNSGIRDWYDCPRLRRSKLRLYLMWKKWAKSYKVAVISFAYVYRKDPASYLASEKLKWNGYDLPPQRPR